MSEDRFQPLNDKVDELIQSYTRAQRENHVLRAEARLWQHERRRLLQKSRDTKSQLESLLLRLKALDNS